MRVFLRKAAFVGLVINWEVFLLVGTIWIVSEFRQERIHYVIKNYEAPHGILSFNAIGGGCYIGGQRWHVDLPLHLITFVLAAWPVVDRVRRIRARGGRRDLLKLFVILTLLHLALVTLACGSLEAALVYLVVSTPIMWIAGLLGAVMLERVAARYGVAAHKKTRARVVVLACSATIIASWGLQVPMKEAVAVTVLLTLAGAALGNQRLSKWQRIQGEMPGETEE